MQYPPPRVVPSALTPVLKVYYHHWNNGVNGGLVVMGRVLKEELMGTKNHKANPGKPHWMQGNRRSGERRLCALVSEGQPREGDL